MDVRDGQLGGDAVVGEEVGEGFVVGRLAEAADVVVAGGRRCDGRGGGGGWGGGYGGCC